MPPRLPSPLAGQPPSRGRSVHFDPGFFCLVLSREWGNGLWELLLGLYRDYRDPFPHYILSTTGSYSGTCVSCHHDISRIPHWSTVIQIPIFVY